ncbi:MAG: glycosyltransferase family 4 protein, partial [Mesorhizobium sp.]
MNLLFATSIVPDGTRSSGYEIANAAIIASLRRAGVRLTMLGYTWPGKSPEDPANTISLGSVDVRTEGASAFQKATWLMRAVMSGKTFSAVKLVQAGDATVRRAIQERGPFDGYVLNSVQFAGAFETSLRDRPSIFVAHNVEHRSALQNAASTTGIERRLFRREAGLLEALEKRLCERARFIFTLAEEDRAALGVAGDDRSLALPLITRDAPPLATPRRQVDCDAALIGTWTWQPNRIGLDWFLHSVTPHLPPDFRIRIAGHVPSDMQATHPGVEFVGRVPDATRFVRAAAVIPLISRAGTGVQLQPLETFELGLPSVATTGSLRGISYRPANC